MFEDTVIPIHSTQRLLILNTALQITHKHNCLPKNKVKTNKVIIAFISIFNNNFTAKT